MYTPSKHDGTGPVLGQYWAGVGKRICKKSHLLGCLIPRGECSHAAYKGNGLKAYTTFFSRSTRYPLLLGGQRRCGFIAFPRLLHMTSTAGIKPQTSRSRVLHLNHSATSSKSKLSHSQCYNNISPI